MHVSETSCMFTRYVTGACEGQKMMLEPLKLKLQIAECCLMWCWERNRGLLEEHQKLLNTELPLQPTKVNCKQNAFSKLRIETVVKATL